MIDHRKDDIFPGIQDFFKGFGEAGCLAFCLLEIAKEVNQRELNVVAELVEAVNQGYIKYNMQNWRDPDNCYVTLPEVWLSSMTKKRFTYEKILQLSGKGPPPSKAGTWVIECYDSKHFRLRGGWDSLVASAAVATKRITSWRVVTLVK